MVPRGHSPPIFLKCTTVWIFPVVTSNGGTVFHVGFWREYSLLMADICLHFEVISHNTMYKRANERSWFWSHDWKHVIWTNERPSGWPHSDQVKIPCVFPEISLCFKVFPCVFFFVSKYNIYSIISSTDITKVKRLPTSHHNSEISFTFKTSKFSLCWELNSLRKIIFLIFFGKFPVFSLSGKMNIQILCFPRAVATLTFFFVPFQMSTKRNEQGGN